MAKIKVELPISILRYPGGKSRIIQQIVNCLPKYFEEYREPMVGGGSLFLFLKQTYPLKRFWINDINYDLISFWKSLRDEPDEFIKSIRDVKESIKDGKQLYYKLKNDYGKINDTFEAGKRFFILNRITYSGLTDAGGYSELSFKTRFTNNSINNLSRISPLLTDVKITCESYERVISSFGSGVFLFIDPPYESAKPGKLYGRGGIYGNDFDNLKLRQELGKTDHKWLLTYDKSETIKNYYKSIAFIDEVTVQYGTNAYGNGDSAKKGLELFIHNYEC